jgi:HAD superfamily hydrolase (TIGR01490 family)
MAPRTPRSATTRSAAFFDLDGTLIAGSANIPLALAAFKAGYVTPAELITDLRNNLSFLLKGASDERSEQVRDRILAAVQGRLAADLVALADDFMDSLVAKVQPAARAALDEHAAAGHDRIVISASPTEIVGRLAEELGLEYGIGTTAEHEEGVYTGRLVGPFCYREGKAEVLRQVAHERGYDLSRSYAYSDSISDLPMLRAVGTPVAVNPDAELRALAVSEGWTIIETSSVSRGGLPVPPPGEWLSTAVSLPGRALRISSWVVVLSAHQASASARGILASWQVSARALRASSS